MELRGKAALITGGRRVGGHLALELARRGCSVALTWRSDRDAVERIADRARAEGVGAVVVRADLSRAEEAERAVDETVAALGRIDALAALASVYRRTPFDELVPGDFDDMIGANLATSYHAAIAAARRMRGNSGEPRGKILFFGDWAVERPYRDFLPYFVAKGGLTALTLGLARELAPGILVNLIQPGTIEPPPDQSEDRLRGVLDATPLRRVGSPSDAVNLALYLLEGTDFATGGVYRVDGGRFLGPEEVGD